MVDIVDGFVADVHLDEELHRRDDIVLYQGIFGNGLGVVEFLVQLVASDAAEVVAAGREEHGNQVLLGGFYGYGFAGHQHGVDGGKSVVAGRLVRFGVSAGIPDLFPLEAVDDHRRIERIRMIEIDDLNF